MKYVAANLTASRRAATSIIFYTHPAVCIYRAVNLLLEGVARKAVSAAYQKPLPQSCGVRALCLRAFIQSIPLGSKKAAVPPPPPHERSAQHRKI